MEIRPVMARYFCNRSVGLVLYFGDMHGGDWR
jgi:hypothetical protein